MEFLNLPLGFSEKVDVFGSHFYLLIVIFGYGHARLKSDINLVQNLYWEMLLLSKTVAISSRSASFKNNLAAPIEVVNIFEKIS